jgi:hypothetical protein
MRLLVTLTLLAIFFMATLVRLPGIDMSNVIAVNGSPGLSIMAVGIRPLMVTFATVELLSFVVPMGRQLRRGGIAGRRRLNLFAIRAGVAVAILQAAGLTITLLRQAPGGLPLVPNPGFLFFVSSVSTLVAGTMLTFLIAQFVSRWGVGNGFCMFILVDLVWPALAQGRDLVLSSYTSWNPLELLAWIAAIGMLVRAFVRRPEAVLRDSQQEVIPVKLPVFPQGIVPVTWTYSLLSIFDTLSLVFPSSEELLPLPVALVGSAVFIAALSPATFHLFSSRKRLEGNLPSGALPAEGDVWDGRSLTQSTALLVAFGVGFLGGTWFLGFRFSEILAFPEFVMLVALIFDLVAEWSFRQKHGDRVTTAIQMDNVYHACYLQGLLAKNGIGSLVRCFQFRSLFFFLAPLFKMELIVPTTEWNRALEIIRPDRIEIV